MQWRTKVCAAHLRGYDALMIGRTTNFVIRLNKGCKILSFHTRLLKSGESFVFAFCDAESRAVNIVMKCASGQKYLENFLFSKYTQGYLEYEVEEGILY